MPPAPSQPSAEWMRALRVRLRARCESSGLVWIAVTEPLEPAVAPLEVRCLHLTPTRRILALAGWRDTDEDVDVLDGQRCCWTSHEVGKGIRLLLRQSHAMLELFGAIQSNPLMENDFPAWAESLRELAPRAITRQAVSTYRAVGASWVASSRSGTGSREAARQLLTGWLLAEHHELSTAPGRLIDYGELRGGAAASLARLLAGDEAEPMALELGLEGLAEAERRTSLPARPPAYDELSRWLVRLRMAGPGATT